MTTIKKFTYILLPIVLMLTFFSVSAKPSEKTVYLCSFTSDNDLNFISAQHGNVFCNSDGLTVSTNGYNDSGDATTYAKLSFGNILDNLSMSVRIKKPCITDSNGNIITDTQTRSSSYMLWLTSDTEVDIPLFSFDHLGNLIRTAGNSNTLYKSAVQPLYDNDGYCWLKINFKSENDGFWYAYVYDMYDNSEIYCERFLGFNKGTIGAKVGSLRMNSELRSGTKWAFTVKDIYITSQIDTVEGIIDETLFTDGSGNPISIGYFADEVKIKFKIADDVDKNYRLYAYLTGYIGEKLKSVRRILIDVTEEDAGKEIYYTFDTDATDMVKKVYVFDENLSPVFKNIPSLYLLDNAENGEKIKYIEAYAIIDSYNTDYGNIKILDKNGKECANVLNTYYYPEDNLIRIKVDNTDNCPYVVNIDGLATSDITGYAYRGYQEILYGTFIKGIRYDQENNKIVVNICNSSNENQDKFLTVFEQSADETLNVINSISITVNANSEEKATIPYSKGLTEGIYAILQ